MNYETGVERKNFGGREPRMLWYERKEDLNTGKELEEITEEELMIYNLDES